MIIDELTNHVGNVMIGLRAEYIRQPDRACQILDSYSRYKRGGAAGQGISITQLVEHGASRFYRGLDTQPAVEDNSETRQHFATWNNMKTDVVLQGTHIEEACGLKTMDLMTQERSLGHSKETDQLAFLNLVETKYRAAATGSQSKKVQAFWGHYLPDNEKDRAPESLDDLFNEDGDWHGLNPGDLGEFPDTHPWGRNPINSDASKLRHRPQIFDKGGEEISLEMIDRDTMEVSLVNPGPYLGLLWSKGFSKLAAEILNKNDKVPLLYGTEKWTYSIQCIRINNYTIIPDPNMIEGKMRGLHVGMPGGMDGTFFPFYWDSMGDDVADFGMLAQEQITDVPAGLDFGFGREIPWYGMEWHRSDRYFDAVDTGVLLKYTNVCLERGFQTEWRGLNA